MLCLTYSRKAHSPWREKEEFIWQCLCVKPRIYSRGSKSLTHNAHSLFKRMATVISSWQGFAYYNDGQRVWIYPQVWVLFIYLLFISPKSWAREQFFKPPQVGSLQQGHLQGVHWMWMCVRVTATPNGLWDIISFLTQNLLGCDIWKFYSRR